MQTEITGQSAEKPPIHPLAMTCCLQFGLTPAEGAALARLLRGDVVSNEELYTIVSGTPGGHPKIVPVVINRLRNKLAEHGIRIINRPRLGYRLGRGARALLAIGQTEAERA
jgi:DNA-binding response OmpR family regulator